MPIKPKRLNNGLAIVRPFRLGLCVNESAMLERWSVGTIKYKDHDARRLAKELTQLEKENTKLVRHFVSIKVSILICSDTFVHDDTW
jgi:hypothetical protein